MFYLDSTTNYIVANPSIYLEGGLKTQIDFIMPFFEYTIRYNFEGFKYSPLDWTFMWQISSAQPWDWTNAKYCTALQWSTRGMRSAVTT